MQKRRLGRHYRLSPLGTSLAIEFTGQPFVDRKQMSARAIISTATVDRVGDVLIPQGCQIANYAKNPVVLWAHGFEGIGQPIGTSRDPNGNVAVVISKDDVQATSWFSQSSLEAAQIFELIDEGIVRATSVRETPIKSHIRHAPKAGEILVVEEWDLEEWSWCAVGINPDAVAKALHRNRLGGQPIVPSIFNSLHAVAIPPRRFGVGLPTEKTVSDNNQTIDETINATDDDWDDDDGVELGTQPYGSTVVCAVHTSLSSACQNIVDAMGPLENPTVKEGLQAILTSLQEQMMALEGLHSSSYPNQPNLKSETKDDAQDDESMKAFLASAFGFLCRWGQITSNHAASVEYLLDNVHHMISQPAIFTMSLYGFDFGSYVSQQYMCYDFTCAGGVFVNTTTPRDGDNLWGCSGYTTTWPDTLTITGCACP